jgi:hypothetical protein
MPFKKKNFLPFNKARAIVIKESDRLGINSNDKWFEYCKSGDKREDIPTSPSYVYKNKGWISFRHWLGLSRTSGTSKKYYFNEDFFKTWSHDMAYILGFWFADGCIKGGNRFTISQHKDDRYLLEKILISMESNYKISIYKNMATLNICSRDIVEDIKSLGGTERKSLCCKMPFVPSEYLPDFVRGLWDGDGTIWYNTIDNCYESGFCSGSGIFVNELFLILKKEIPNLHGRVCKRTHNGGYINGILYLMNFGKNDTIRLKKFLYRSPSTLFLKRKYDLFQKTGEITIARNSMMSYKDSEFYVKSLNIKSREKLFNFWKINGRPIGIPFRPDSVYKNKGWVSWSKWLGRNDNSNRRNIKERGQYGNK